MRGEIHTHNRFARREGGALMDLARYMRPVRIARLCFCLFVEIQGDVTNK